VWNDSCYSDYTDSDVQAPGAHAWDVMASGMYGGENNPPNYSAFERNFMGWLDYASLEDSSDVKVLPPLDASNFAYKVKVTDDEWFVLENRRMNKWDAVLPNHGMLVWHIEYDETSWNGDKLNDDPRHQYVDIVEAGDLHVMGYYNGFSCCDGANMKDDPFPGNQNITKLSPVLSWSGDTVLAGLFNILESGSNVCFSLSPDIAVNDCEKSSASSNSKVAGAMRDFEFGYANNEITVVLRQTSMVRVQVFDLMGHLVETFAESVVSSKNFDLAHLKKGNYVARIESNRFAHTAKIVVK
jgi:hypothetical protein